MVRYGLEDVVQCLERELKLRQRLYPGRVAHRRMTKKAADREIAIMAQLLADHQALLERERKDAEFLF